MSNIERYIRLHNIVPLTDGVPKVDAWVVIPCYNEPHLLGTLHSLLQCQRKGMVVGVIVVVNSGVLAPEAALVQNAKTLVELEDFIQTHLRNDSSFHLLKMNVPNIRKKHTGPGFARKLGMDWAAVHHYTWKNDRGIILSLDADCLVSDSYFKETIGFFEQHPKAAAASIYFEHPTSGTEFEAELYDAIVLYEIYLRYYVLALRSIGYQEAFYTLGSAFAVRAQTYVDQGGMNRKNAGEDFYFLQKIIPLGHFHEIHTTTVFPAPRLSDRVVFGTGPALKKILETGDLKTYPLELFQTLKVQLGEQRFSGLMVVKFLNAGMESGFAPSDVLEEACKLMAAPQYRNDPKALLSLLRKTSLS